MKNSVNIAHRRRVSRKSGFGFGKNIGLLVVGVGLCVFGAGASAAHGQARDPFQPPVIRVPVRRKPVVKKEAAEVKKPSVPIPIAAPPIQSRIDNYKMIRQRCAELGVQCPKPTSVLTIDEMNVTGVFRTPRGYAAMVQATPIKLSYTIYPGEKFYDGQLVAIEEGKLTFRRVVQMSDGKEIVAAENKALVQAGINGMASSRAENAAPMNPTITMPNQSAAPGGGLSAEAVPMIEPKQTAPVAAPPVKINQLPQTNFGTDSEIKLSQDEKQIAAPAPAKKSKKTPARKP